MGEKHWIHTHHLRMTLPRYVLILQWCLSNTVLQNESSETAMDKSWGKECEGERDSVPQVLFSLESQRLVTINPLQVWHRKGDRRVHTGLRWNCSDNAAQASFALEVCCKYWHKWQILWSCGICCFWKTDIITYTVNWGFTLLPADHVGPLSNLSGPMMSPKQTSALPFSAIIQCAAGGRWLLIGRSLMWQGHSPFLALEGSQGVKLPHWRLAKCLSFDSLAVLIYNCHWISGHNYGGAFN